MCTHRLRRKFYISKSSADCIRLGLHRLQLYACEMMNAEWKDSGLLWPLHTLKNKPTRQ